MIEEMLAVRGIDVSHETIRRWVLKFGQEFANRARRRLPTPGDKWHMDEVAIAIGGTKHWLWRAVDQNGVELDILIQSRRNNHEALGFSLGPFSFGSEPTHGGSGGVFFKSRRRSKDGRPVSVNADRLALARSGASRKFASSTRGPGGERRLNSLESAGPPLLLG
jgi:DDE domain